MKIIGLTGGIATGKSEVANAIRIMGIPVFDADAAVHEIYQNGVAAEALKDICPLAIEGKNVDRDKLSELIKNDPSLLKTIESLIHPLVRQAENSFLLKARQSRSKIAVIDSPLLIETGHHKDMDVVIVIETPYKNQKARAMERPNMSAAKFELIYAKQMPAAEKRNHANFIVENNATLGELEQKTKTIITKIMNETN